MYSRNDYHFSFLFQLSVAQSITNVTMASVCLEAPVDVTEQQIVLMAVMRTAVSFVDTCTMYIHVY